ncbi:MAG TPA: phosphate ABC transporter ATP-binding protein [Candidatus Acidoferrum sp.]|nr:phosphate ABC transporter ATP-binding protein [Candidatus Acidoferrum sp.]
MLVENLIKKTVASNVHISVRNLNVSYENVQVLKNINVDIPRGEITAVIGPSGCGKTTFLRSLNRLIELVTDVKISCNILVDDVDIMGKEVDVTDVRKRLSLIAQTPNLLPMSIFDNIAYGPRVHQTNCQLAEIVERCLRSAGLWEEVKNRLKEPASLLSIGQQQRLCLARALAVEPEVLLCDEPTSALDPQSAQHVEKYLQALREDYTIVFVTHTLRQARRIADNVLFLYWGELVEQGPARSFFNQPQNPITKAYLEGAFG